MKNAILLAFALSICMTNVVQTAFAGTNEPAVAATDQMKVKPAKKAAPHKHEHHSLLKGHKSHRVV
jgi:hypothetical protein